MKTENLAKMKKLQQDARQRILERGKIEFRVEPDLMVAVLDLAQERKMPVGPMIRQWVSERIVQETKNSAKPKSQLDVIEHKLDALLKRSKTALA